MDYNMMPALSLLLAETDQHTRDSLIDYFSQYAAAKVKSAANCQDALAGFVPGIYDCAIIEADMKGPGINGLTLASRLREKDPDLTLILTSHASDKVAQIFAMGFDDFLLKPFTLETLPCIINNSRMRHAYYREKQRNFEQYQNKLQRLNLSLLAQVKEPALFNKLAHKLNQLDLSSNIYPAMVKLAASCAKCGQAAIMVLDHEQKNLVLLAEYGFGNQFFGQPVAWLGRGLVGKVAAEAQPMLARPGIDQPSEILPARGMCLAMPICMHELVFGVLLLADKKTSFTAQDFFLLNFLINKMSLEIENCALYEYTSHNMHSILAALISATEAKDLYTGQHSQRVTSIALLIGQSMGLDSSSLNSLRLATYLHDIGKIGIKDDVLLKAGRLTDKEYKVIQQHPLIGDNIVSPLNLSWEERAIVAHHHERWDGSGYPYGLKGEDIPLLARVVAVADTYDAITSNRPYRPAGSLQTAITEITNCAGSQFDPNIVNYFVQAINSLQPEKVEVNNGFHGQTTLSGASTG